MGHLNAGSLLEPRVLLGLCCGVGEKVDGAFSLVLGGNVASDGSALVESEAVVLGVRNLAERLDLQEGLGLVFIVGKVDLDDLEGDVVLVEYNGDTGGASGDGGAVKLEDHGECGEGVQARASKSEFIHTFFFS